MTYLATDGVALSGISHFSSLAALTMITANTFRLIFTRYSMLPINIATGILIARVLGPIGLGLYTLMLWLPSVLAGPMSLGLGNANLFFAGRDPAMARTLVANSVVASVAVSALLLTAAFLIITFAPAVLPTGLGRWHIMVPLLDLPFRMFNMYGANIFNALKQHQTYRRCEVVQTVAYGLAVFATVLLLDMTLWGFVLSQLSASVVTASYTLGMLVRDRNFGFRPDLPLLKQSIIYGGKIQIGSIMRVAGQRIDELLLFQFAGAGPLGMFTLGRNITNRIRIIPMSLGTVLVPELSKADDLSHVLVTMAIRRLVALMILIVIAGIVLALPLVPLVYGDAFQRAVGPIQILLLGLIPLSVQRILIMYLIATGKAGEFVRLAAVGLLATVVMDLVLIPYLGLYGAAIGSVIGLTVEMLYALIIFTRRTGIGWSQIILPRRADINALWKVVGAISWSRKGNNA